MSFSTTATTTFELVKYSRAYSHSPQAELEWQHFVNPVIRLMLDTRKTCSGSLESYRIIWAFSSAQDTMEVDRREMAFVRIVIALIALLTSQFEEDFEFMNCSDLTS